MIRLTLRQMEYCEALAESLHFGRAAALVGVTQPALSAQIAEMEEKLGCRLFERGRAGVRRASPPYYRKSARSRRRRRAVAGRWKDVSGSA
jgi:hypothetical protein